MTLPFPDEVKANLERVVQSLEAARQLMSGASAVRQDWEVK